MVMGALQRHLLPIHPSLHLSSPSTRTMDKILTCILGSHIAAPLHPLLQLPYPALLQLPYPALQQIARELHADGADGSLGAFSRTCRAVSEAALPVLWEQMEWIKDSEGFRYDWEAMLVEGCRAGRYTRDLTVESWSWKQNDSSTWRLLSHAFPSLVYLSLTVPDVALLPSPGIIFPNLRHLCVRDIGALSRFYTLAVPLETDCYRPYLHFNPQISFPRLDSLVLVGHAAATLAFWRKQTVYWEGGTKHSHGFKNVDRVRVSAAVGREDLAVRFLADLVPNVTDVELQLRKQWPRSSLEILTGTVRIPALSELSNLQHLNILAVIEDSTVSLSSPRPERRLPDPILLIQDFSRQPDPWGNLPFVPLPRDGVGAVARGLRTLAPGLVSVKVGWWLQEGPEEARHTVKKYVELDWREIGGWFEKKGIIDD